MFQTRQSRKSRDKDVNRIKQYMEGESIPPARGTKALVSNPANASVR